MASFSRSPGLNLSRPVITGGPQSSAGAAAGNVNLGNTFGSLRKNGPRFDEIAATAIANKARERATVIGIEGDIAAQGVAAYGATKGAKIQAEAAKDAAAKQARGSMIGSAFGAIGSIGGALLSGGLA